MERLASGTRRVKADARRKHEQLLEESHQLGGQLEVERRQAAHLQEEAKREKARSSKIKGELTNESAQVRGHIIGHARNNM